MYGRTIWITIGMFCCLGLLAFSSAQSSMAQPAKYALTPEQQDHLVEEIERRLAFAYREAEEQLQLAMAEAENNEARQMISRALQAVQQPPNLAAPTQAGAVPAVVFVWQDNDPFHSKYSPCILPFLLGPQEATYYSTPITAARELQPAIDKAHEMATNLMQPVPVIVIPSFLPEVLRFVTFGICGGSNFGPFEEQLELKSGVVLVGIPIGGKIRVRSPYDGPTLKAVSPFGQSTSFEDVLLQVGLEVGEVVNELADQILASTLHAMTQRLADLAKPIVEQALDVVLEQILTLDDDGELFQFLKDAFEFLDDQVEAIAGDQGILDLAFGGLVDLIGSEAEELQSFREKLKLDSQSAIRQWLGDGKAPGEVSGPEMLHSLASNLIDAASPYLDDEGFQQLLGQLLENTPAFRDKEFKVDIEDAVARLLLNNLGGGLKDELADILSFLPGDLHNLLSDASGELVDMILRDVIVDEIAALYQSLAEDAFQELSSVFTEIFGGGVIGQTKQDLFMIGHNLGDQLGNTVSDALETELFEEANSALELADEISLPVEEMGAELMQAMENIAGQALTSLAAKTLNVGLTFGMHFTHAPGRSGPGILSDGALLVAIFNDVIGNRAHGNGGESNLPDDGETGAGVVVRGYIPSIFILNRVSGNHALRDAGGVYFGEGFGSIWAFNTISGNRAENDGGGVMFDTDAISLFVFNRVNNNHAARAGGVYLHSTNALVHGNTIAGNRSGSDGGGVYVDVNGTLTGNRIANNRAIRSGGGAAIVESRPGLSGNSIAANLALADGGGIAVLGEGASPNIGPGNSIGGNSTPGRGGGIYVDPFAAPTITRNRIAGNFAEQGGGGVYWSPPAIAAGGARVASVVAQAPIQRPALSGNIFDGNTTPAHGGGLALIQTFSTLDGNRFHGNRAGGEGGGAYIVDIEQAVLRGNGFSNNESTLGGGLRLDRVLDVNTRSNWFTGNRSATHGGGIAMDSGELLVSEEDSWRGNVAPERGGGAWIVDVTQANLDGARLTGNRAGNHGGGIYSTRSSAWNVNRSAFSRNVASARGGGIALEEIGPAAIHSTIFEDNGAASDGGGLAIWNIPELRMTASTLQRNQADMNRNGDQRGGGAYFEDIPLLNVFDNEFLENAADWGGGVSIVRCASATLQANHFARNRTDTNNDGFGDGGGGLAEGPGTFVHLGGSNSAGEGNMFTGNTAGSPAPAPREANGGAFAIIAQAHGDIFGNVFQSNACTYTGGALYVSRTAPGTRIGGFLPGEGGEGSGDPSDFSNLGVQNCTEVLPVLDEIVIVEVERIPDRVICLEPIEICECEGETDIPFLILDEHGDGSIENLFAGVEPGLIGISAAAVPANGGDVNAAMRIHAEGGEVLFSDGFTAETVVEYEGGPLPFTVSVSAPGPEPPDAPILTLTPLDGNACSVGPFTLALSLDNLAEDSSILFFALELTLQDPVRYQFLGAEGANHVSVVVEPISDTSVMLFGEVDHENFTGGLLAALLLEAAAPAPPTADAIPSPLEIRVETMVDNHENLVDPIVQIPMPFLSCPSGDFIPPAPPEKDCEEFEIWVMIRHIQGVDRILVRRSVESGVEGYPAPFSQLSAGRILTQDGVVSPSEDIYSHHDGIDDNEFQFHATAGQVIDVTVTLADLQPEQALPIIQLRDAMGVVADATNANGPAESLRIVATPLPRSGTYELAVSPLPGQATPFAGAFRLEMALDGDAATRGDARPITEVPTYDDDRQALDAILVFEWPDPMQAGTQNAAFAQLDGDARQIAPPWPYSFDWRPDIDLTHAIDLGPSPRFSYATPMRRRGVGEPGGIITWRGGFLGIVNAPTVLVDNNTVEGNYAEAYGGGAFVTIADLSVELGTPRFGNVWRGNQSLFGGGVAIQDATPVIQNNVIGHMDAPNAARFGAGLYLESSGAVVGGYSEDESNQFIGNVAGFNIADGIALPPIPAEIQSPNSGYAAAGGGVLIRDSSPQFVNNVIERNSVSARTVAGIEPSGFYRMGGGGLAAVGSHVIIADVTLAHNQVRPLEMPLDAHIHVDVLGGGVLVDDSMFEDENEELEPFVELVRVTMTDNRIVYTAVGLNENEPLLQFNLQGGTLAARENRELLVHNSRIHNSMITKAHHWLTPQDDAETIGHGPYAHALGGAIAIVDGAVVTLRENVIRRSETALFGENARAYGGAAAIVDASATVENNWFLHSRSSGSGGAIYLRDAQGAFIRNTVANGRAAGFGGALFLDETAENSSAPEMRIADNILEAFGAEESSAVHFVISPPIGDATPVAFHHNNVIAAVGRIYSGTDTDFTGEAGLISEPLRYRNAEAGDFSLGENSLSSTAARDGGPLGWNPSGLHDLAAPRILRVSEDYVTISDALDAANYGDQVWISPGTYEESIIVPAGVWVRTVSGPWYTHLINPDPDAIDSVGVVATLAGSRAVASGLSVHNFDVGLRTDTRSGIVIADMIVNPATDAIESVTTEIGLDVVDIPAFADPEGDYHVPWIAENSIRYVTTGIRIGHRPGLHEEREAEFCALDIPIPPETRFPPVPWTHHNVVADTQDGVEFIWLGMDAPRYVRLPILHNDIIPDATREGAAYLALPDLTGAQFNISEDPLFVEESVLPRGGSPLSALLRPDERRIGALRAMDMPGDLNGDGRFDELDILLLAALVEGRIQEEDLPIFIDDEITLLVRADWNGDGLLDWNDVRLAARVFVGEVEMEATPLWEAWLERLEKGGPVQ